MATAYPMLVLWFLVGLAAGALFIMLARSLGERRMFSVALIVTAFIYVGFAAFESAALVWIGVELLGALAYSAIAVLGFRYTQWWLVLGWGAHPLWDVGLHLLGGGSAFAPAWYAVLCVSFDLVVAAYIASQCGRQQAPENLPS